MSIDKYIDSYKFCNNNKELSISKLEITKEIGVMKLELKKT